jgi:ABC-type nitrate/sulfonate/bicarbonate transport system substrate-binding protein
MQRTIAALAGLLIVAALLIAGCAQNPPPSENATVEILYANAGQMPQLLATNQIDGFLIWQPQVEYANLSGVGKILAYSQDLPPYIWKDHTCCAFIAREDQIEQYPDFVNAMSALVIAGTNYTSEHPNRAAIVTADWLSGGTPIVVGNVTLDAVDVEEHAMPTFKFTSDVTDNWIESNERFIQAYIDLGLITGELKDASPSEQDALIFDFRPYENATTMLAEGSIKTPARMQKAVTLGYLPSDHDAPLFLMLRDWQYFQETYGITLKPRDLNAVRPETADLIVNNETIATVNIVQGQGGAPVVTAMGQDAIQYAIIGTPPTIIAIDKGTPVKILQPVQTEGSALVIASGAPADDWPSFVSWAEQRSTSGKPLVIATVQGSIQDVILRYALQYGELNIELKQ